MIKLINAFNVQCCMTNKKRWEGRKRTLLFQSDLTYRRILLETRLEDPFYHFTSYSSSTEVYFTFFFYSGFPRYYEGQRTGSHSKSSLSPARLRCIEVFFNGIAGSQNIVCYTKEFVIYRGQFYIEVSRFKFCIKQQQLYNLHTNAISIIN